MIQKNLKIENIPAILWGDKGNKLFIAVHGNMSNKCDDVITIFAEEAIKAGYRVLSFDLPKHGERKDEDYPCKVQNCVKDLKIIMNFAKSICNDISVFACSMGAYFSLLSYGNEDIGNCLFLSPVVNMERIINNMMKWFDVSEEMLKIKQEIELPIGETLYYDYYCYVKEHPIRICNKSTSILYGLKDNLCEFDIISNFSKDFNCDLQIVDNGEHYFHTKEQLQSFRKWVENMIAK